MNRWINTEGRTTLNREDLNRGVLTLLISSVQTSDSGPYRCFVPKTRKSSCTFNLTVEDCLKRLRVKKRTSNGSEERDEDQERPLKTVV
ncbi:hypothetical protein GBF38_000114 [Nibea albiflora]|nr:hypothetical protein GBF38_000114 [Nibea albiflora]